MTKRPVTTSLILALMLIGGAATTLFAQGGRAADNVLFPHPIPIPRTLVGLDGGWGYWMNSGRFSVSDIDLPCANFADGNGHGPAVGARAFVYLTRAVFLSPRIRYELRPVIFTTPLAGEPVRDQFNAVVTLKQEAQARGEFDVATFDAMLGWQPFTVGLYAIGGASAGLIVSSGFDYTEHIIAPAGIVYNDTKTTSHTPSANRQWAAPNSTTFALRGGIGYLHRMGRLTINPEIFFTQSITPLLAEPDAMDQRGIVGLIGVLWEL